MVALIVKHRGRDLPQTEQIKQVLDDAIRPCRERNLLAHGAWWCFNRREMYIMVRGGVRWDDQQSPPGNTSTRYLILKREPTVSRRFWWSSTTFADRLKQNRTALKYEKAPAAMSDQG